MGIGRLCLNDLACRDFATEITLNTVIACTADVDCTTLHQEILFTVDAVTHSRGDVQRQVLH